MKDFNRCVGIRLGGILCILATTALAQAPTMSLEAVAIDGKSLGDGPKAQLDASPGDIITAEIYIRDWSPNGELLSGYQVALLPISFASGRRGSIEPVQYAALQKTGAENPDNFFIDDNHPPRRPTTRLAATTAAKSTSYARLVRGSQPNRKAPA